MKKNEQLTISQPLIITGIALIFSIIYLVNIVYFSNTIKKITTQKFFCLDEITNIEFFISNLNNFDSTIDTTSDNYDEVYSLILCERNNIRYQKETGIHLSIKNLYDEGTINKNSMDNLSNELIEYIDMVLYRFKYDNANSTHFSSLYNSLKEEMRELKNQISLEITDLSFQLTKQVITTTITALCASITIISIAIIFTIKQRKISKYLNTRNQILEILTVNTRQGIIIYNLDHDRIEFETQNIKDIRKIYNGSFYDYMNDEDIKLIKNNILNKDFKNQINFEIKLEKNDILNWYYISAFPSYEKNSLKRIFFTVSDFTEIKEYNKKLLDAMNETKNANLAKRQFLSSMSHEIRTPITTIIGLTELSLLNVSNHEKITENLKNIDISSKHLLSLVNDILDFSKIESGKIEIKKEAFDINELIDSTITIIRPQAIEKKLSFIINNHTNSKKIIGDYKKLKQILINILSNAIKYSVISGEISLSIIENINNDQKNLKFIIADNGIGMSEDRLKKLFIPYERENYESTGTGLGLVITKDIITLMGGTISIDSKIDFGTTVTIVIPFEEASEINEETNKNYDFTGMKILIVDDNSINAKIIKELLEIKGAKISICNNGKKAITCCQKNTYDLILMDIQMPIMNGYDATREIRNKGYTNPIVALTANAFSNDIIDTIKCGMNSYLIKPVTMNILYAKVNEYKKK